MLRCEVSVQLVGARWAQLPPEEKQVWATKAATARRSDRGAVSDASEDGGVGDVSEEEDAARPVRRRRRPPPPAPVLALASAAPGVSTRRQGMRKLHHAHFIIGGLLGYSFRRKFERQP